MSQPIDFSNCKLSGNVYGGSERKIGIIYDDSPYILKFQKKSNSEKSFSHISEHLSSHIYYKLGIDVHKTLLGYYDGEEVVALKDFTGDSKLVEFNSIGESTIDSSNDAEHHSYNYSVIRDLIYSNKKLLNPRQVENRFWQMFCIDALIGNFDRHGFNWGYLYNPDTDTYTCAPVYDNGSSLFPRLPDREIASVITSQEELDKRTYTFPTSQIKLNGNKSSYYNIIASHQFPICDDVANWLMYRFNMDDISNLIDETPFISDARKIFYKTIIQYRFTKLIKETRR